MSWMASILFRVSCFTPEHLLTIFFKATAAISARNNRHFCYLLFPISPATPLKNSPGRASVFSFWATDDGGQRLSCRTRRHSPRFRQEPCTKHNPSYRNNFCSTDFRFIVRTIPLIKSALFSEEISTCVQTLHPFGPIVCSLCAFSWFLLLRLGP